MLTIGCQKCKRFHVCYADNRLSPRKNPAAVALGRMKSAKKAAAAAENGRTSARKRMRDMTPEQRSEIARKAAAARWAKKR